MRRRKLDIVRNLSTITISLFHASFAKNVQSELTHLTRTRKLCWSLAHAQPGTGRKARVLQPVESCTRPFNLIVSAPVRSVIFDTLVFFCLPGRSVIFEPVLASLALLEEPTLAYPNDVNNNIIFHMTCHHRRLPHAELVGASLGFPFVQFTNYFFGYSAGVTFKVFFFFSNGKS